MWTFHAASRANNTLHGPTRTTITTTQKDLTMVVHALRTTAARGFARAQQKRTMGGGPKPEWTGIDAKVRAVFPEDWQRE